MGASRGLRESRGTIVAFSSVQLPNCTCRDKLLLPSQKRNNGRTSSPHSADTLCAVRQHLQFRVRRCLRRRRPRRGELGLWVRHRLHRLRPPHLASVHRDLQLFIRRYMQRRRPRRGELGLWVRHRLHRLRPTHLGRLAAPCPCPCHRAAADLRQRFDWLCISMLRKS